MSVWRCLWCVASAMKVFQSLGIVHRDLKPQNLLLCHSSCQTPPPNELKLKIGQTPCLHCAFTGIVPDLLQFQPELDLAWFRKSYPAGDGHGFGENLFWDYRTNTPDETNGINNAVRSCIQCESKKSPPPWNFLTFFPNSWEFLVQILHAYYAFLSTLDYEFLFNYLQLWRSYAILSVTSDHPVHIMCAKCPPSAERHAWWSHLIWHKFVKVADNWIKIGSLA